mgnify:CR=1 FL=1
MVGNPVNGLPPVHGCVSGMVVCGVGPLKGATTYITSYPVAPYSPDCTEFTGFTRLKAVAPAFLAPIEQFRRVGGLRRRCNFLAQQVQVARPQTTS